MHSRLPGQGHLLRRGSLRGADALGCAKRREVAQPPGDQRQAGAPADGRAPPGGAWLLKSDNPRMPAIASEENPFRVAVVGSGPSGFYAAEALLRRPNICVDMFDRL